MTKNVFKVLGVSALMAASLSFAAFAAEGTAITTVSFSCGAPEESAIGSGATDPEFVVNESGAPYELINYECTSNPDSAAKNARTYEISFYAADGYYFPKADTISVKPVGKNITEVTRKTVQDDGSTLVVRVKAYPFYAWETPEFEAGAELKLGDAEPDKDERSTKISFDKKGAPSVEYCLVWVDSDDEEHYVHNTTSGTSISIASFNKASYRDKNDRDGDGDLEPTESYVLGISIRATGKAGSNSFTVPSGWNTIGTVDLDNFDLTEYENWGDVFEEAGMVSGEGSGTAAQGPGPGSTQASNGWRQSGSSWYYYQNNQTVKGWVQDGGLWYYTDPATGIMTTGWVQVGGYWYYLKPYSGGPQGSMVTGWLDDGGKRYYLNTGSASTNGIPNGAMYANLTANINGVSYSFDASGALIR